MTATSPPQLKPIQVSEPEAARVLGLCSKTLYNRRRAGKIAFVKEDGRILYRLDELDRYSKSLQTIVDVSK